MKNINIRKLYYHFKHRYLTLNNVVIMVALVIGASWAWGSVGMMQRNYALQKRVDDKVRQEKLAELQVATLKYQGNYYNSTEYKELAAREHLSLADPGEKMLILPPNTVEAEQVDNVTVEHPAQQAATAPPSNVQQWANFLFGGNSRGLQK